jgi:hypothetical protein
VKKDKAERDIDSVGTERWTRKEEYRIERHRKKVETGNGERAEREKGTPRRNILEQIARDKAETARRRKCRNMGEREKVDKE